MEKQQVPAPQIFEHEQFGRIRGVIIDGEPWLVGIDVARALGYQNGSRDINRHVDPEDRREYRFGTPYGVSNFIVINESGLFSLILRSNLPKAREFKRWVTHEVLPSLRKYGYYVMPLQNKQTCLELDDATVDAFYKMISAYAKYSISFYDLYETEKNFNELRTKLICLSRERKVIREEVKKRADEFCSSLKDFFDLLKKD